MTEIAFNVIAAIAGLYFVFFNKRAAEKTIKYWNGIKTDMYGEKDLSWMRPLFVFNGCGFIAYSLRDFWS